MLSGRFSFCVSFCLFVNPHLQGLESPAVSPRTRRAQRTLIPKNHCQAIPLSAICYTRDRPRAEAKPDRVQKKTHWQWYFGMKFESSQRKDSRPKQAICFGNVKRTVQKYRIIGNISEIFRENGPFPKKFRIYFFGEGKGLGQSRSKWACRAAAASAKAGQSPSQSVAVSRSQIAGQCPFARQSFSGGRSVKTQNQKKTKEILLSAFDTATARSADSLAPRSGERVRERGLFHRMAAVCGCADFVVAMKLVRRRRRDIFVVSPCKTIQAPSGAA